MVSILPSTSLVASKYTNPYFNMYKRRSLEHIEVSILLVGEFIFLLVLYSGALKSTWQLKSFKTCFSSVSLIGLYGKSLINGERLSLLICSSLKQFTFTLFFEMVV